MDYFCLIREVCIPQFGLLTAYSHSLIPQFICFADGFEMKTCQKVVNS
jgi:hypothetical protein